MIDFLRWVTLVIIASNIGAFFVVAQLHFKYERSAPWWASLVPGTIAWIATGLVFFFITSAALVWEHLGDEFVWYATPFALPANICVFIGLTKLIRYHRARQIQGRRSEDRRKPF